MLCYDDALREIKDEALTWVNMMRTEYGCRPLTRLPTGNRTKASRCVIARALRGCGDEVQVFSEAMMIRHGTDHFNYELPKMICLFIKAFDAGMYPSLDRKPNGQLPGTGWLAAWFQSQPEFNPIGDRPGMTWTIWGRYQDLMAERQQELVEPVLTG